MRGSLDPYYGCFIALLAYADIALVCLNASLLLNEGKRYWGACMIVFLLAPNYLTWPFLHAGRVARCPEFPLVVLQLGPLQGICEVSAPKFTWCIAIQGLLQAPWTGLLAAYIISCDDEASLFLYLGLVASCVSNASAAVMLNFIGQELSILWQVVEFVTRFVDAVLRLTSLAAFGLIMGYTEDEAELNVPTSMLAWTVFIFIVNVAMISTAEPKCSKSVVCFFAAAMTFSLPLKVIRLFERMSGSVAAFRMAEILILAMMSVLPSLWKPNPCVAILFERCPILCYLIIFCFGFKLLEYTSLNLWLFVNADSTPGYASLQQGSVVAVDSQGVRSYLDKSMQEKLYAAIDAQDLLLVDLYVGLDGAEVNDARVAVMVSQWSPDAKLYLIEKGLPPLSDFTALQLREAGGSASQVVEVGYDIFALKGAGFIASEAKEATGCDLRALAEAGYSLEELQAAGYDVKAIGDTLRAAGIDAQELKDAGFNASDLKSAGYTALEVANVGYDIDDLKEAGYSALQMKAAGESAHRLYKHGYTSVDLQSAGFNMKDAGFRVSEVQPNGHPVDLRELGYSAHDVKEHDYTVFQLKEAGYSAVEVKEAEYPLEDMVKAGYSVIELKQANFTAVELKEAEFDTTSLLEAGFKLKELRQAGVFAEDLQGAGYGLLELRAAGYSTKELKGTHGKKLHKTNDNYLNPGRSSKE